MKSFGNIAKDGQVRAVASGTLTDGKAVIINADGTVSVVAGSASSVGSDAVFASASTNKIKAAFDSSNNKIVIAFRDAGNSNSGTAIVGTISGSSISFGSEAVFTSNNANEINIVFDSNSNKVVISYKDQGNSDYGTAIVGTVSGTSISFGSSVVFESAHSYQMSSTFDSNSNKAVIVYSDVGNSGHGTAIIGTVSGTSISFGTAAVFEAGNTELTCATFDSNSNKVVIGYKDADDSNKGKAVVGTVSGTGISFGSIVTFESSTSINQTTMTFDSNSNKVVLVIRGSSDVGKAYVGTVSGTSISFGSVVNFTDGSSNDTREPQATFDSNANKVVIAYSNKNTKISAISGTVSGTSITFDSQVDVKVGDNLDNITTTFDSNTNKVLIGYRDVSSSNHGTVNIFTSPSTNITSENFIGFSDGAYATTQSAAINTTNTIDRNQSGLTAGQTYFVQTDGTLGLTAADPSVTAGTAISATELIVKG